MRGDLLPSQCVEDVLLSAQLSSRSVPSHTAGPEKLRLPVWFHPLRSHLSSAEALTDVSLLLPEGEKDPGTLRTLWLVVVPTDALYAVRSTDAARPQGPCATV